MSASTCSDGYEEERLAAHRYRQKQDEIASRRERREEDDRLLAPFRDVLDGIAKKAAYAQTHGSMGTTLTDIHNAAQTALQRPLEGTRVRCLMPYRGEQGTVVGWQAALGLPLIVWDELRGEPAEACEPGEYEAIS